MSEYRSNTDIWQDILLPYKTEVEKSNANKNIFAFSPLPTGFGVTIGNAVRRVLLSSIKGSTISEIKIDGIVHEFSMIPGVKEDVDQLMSNLKKIVVSTHTDHEYRLFIKKTGPYTVTGKDLMEQGVDILNPEQEICSITNTGSALNMELVVTTGIGYRAAENVEKDDVTVGTIHLNALYNPILNVAFEVKEIYAGRKMYDKLIFTIETNGAIDGKIALSMAASILSTHLKNLITFEVSGMPQEIQKPNALSVDPKLLQHVNELKLSRRAKTCMEYKRIEYLGDLVTKTEEELLQVPNVGKNSVEEIKKALEKHGLSLGMILIGWPPQNLNLL